MIKNSEIISIILFIIYFFKTIEKNIIKCSSASPLIQTLNSHAPKPMASIKGDI